MTEISKGSNKINEFLNSRYIEAVFPSKEKAADLLTQGKQLSFYLGIDPTGPDIHLGHTTNLFVMKKLKELGHKVILLIGSFTAMIGDPTGKDSARKVLTEAEVKQNMRLYLDQVKKVLPKNYFEVKYNLDWYKKMSAQRMIELTGYITVQQMIARDMFQRRLKDEKPISLREFMYPLLQGYDSVAMNVDGEIGGNDQTFNMLVGRDLSRHILNKDKIVIATRLLEDPTSGKKIMNKSEGHPVSLNDKSEDVFGKTMAMPDSSIVPLFSFATEVDDSKIDEVKNRMASGENPKKLKEELAFELTKMYHGQKAAEKAKDEFEKVFSKGQMPDEIKEFSVAGMKIVDILQGSGLVASASEAKRLIEQKAVEIDGKTVSDWGVLVESGSTIKVGSHRFLKVK